MVSIEAGSLLRLLLDVSDSTADLEKLRFSDAMVSGDIVEKVVLDSGQ